MPSLFAPEPDQHAPRDGDHAATGRFARIAVYRGIDRPTASARPAPDGAPGSPTLTYALPEGTAVVPGQLVSVPLGRGNSAAGGVVLQVGGPELLDGLDPARIKPLLHAGPTVLPGDLLQLARWISDYYVCPLGMVLHAVLPAAVKRATGARRVQLLARAPLSPEQVSAAAAALTRPLRKSWELLQAAGAPAEPATARAIAATVPGVSTAALARLAAAGLLVATSADTVRATGSRHNLPAPTHTSPTPPPTLTPEQAAAVAAIAPTLGRFAVHVLLGVTGSGKTEVYLRLIERVIAAGRSAIVLVPEIALTPQTSDRFLRRFGPGAVAVLHSGLSASQRHAQWARAADPASGTRVVVGARSAVFSPLPSLGLIVVDEEHDSSYKQDQLPRYHARDVAIVRAQRLGCPVVLGSATPSLDTYANALPAPEGDAPAPAPKFTLHRLARRATGAPLPRVEIADLVQERRLRAKQPGAWRDAHLHLIGPTLEAALDRALGAGGQAMLLLNRRGYANHVCCPDPACGWHLACQRCDATMVYHRRPRGPSADTHSGDRTGARPGTVRCHHCLDEALLPAKCPLCAKPVNTFGHGTQRVEDELQRKFFTTHGLRLGSTLLRVDSDSMASAADYFSALDRFARGDARVLLGTQMIAKGLDFPNVQLVGVINADTALALPDFRSEERTFQLVAQVAGRAGRAGTPGRVIVQTVNPTNPAITLAALHDFESFARGELASRARAGLPPSTRMARIVCRDTDLARATHAAETLHAALRQLIEADRAAAHSPSAPAHAVRLRRPAPCAVSRVADHFRIDLQLLAPARGLIQSLLARLRAAGLLTSDAHTAVDVDPVSVL